MGKSSLIIVLGMSVIIAFFILRMNHNSTEHTGTTMNMFEKTHARLIANSGVEIYLEKFKWDRSLISSCPIFNQVLFNGTYDIYAEWDVDVDSILRVTSHSNFMGVNHTTIVETWADIFPIQYPPGALYLSADFIAKLSTGVGNKLATKGSIVLDGRDHYITGVLKEPVENYPQVPAIAVDGLDQLSAVIEYYNDNTNATLEGADPNNDGVSIDVVNDDFDWTDYAQQLADNADIVVTPVTTGVVPAEQKAPWGSLTNPKVTFINGDVKLDNRYVSLDNVIRGCGILIINGNVQINAVFDFVGLVIAYRETDISVDELNLMLNAQGRIIGALVVTGDKINLDATNGNFNILYSRDALMTVDDLILTQRWKILSWWE